MTYYINNNQLIVDLNLVMGVNILLNLWNLEYECYYGILGSEGGNLVVYGDCSVFCLLNSKCYW